jgi:hypothetical protein
MKIIFHPVTGRIVLAASMGLIVGIVIASRPEPRRCQSGVPVGFTAAGCPEDVAKLTERNTR